MVVQIINLSNNQSLSNIIKKDPNLGPFFLPNIIKYIASNIFFGEISNFSVDIVKIFQPFGFQSFEIAGGEPVHKAGR